MPPVAEDNNGWGQMNDVDLLEMEPAITQEAEVENIEPTVDTFVPVQEEPKDHENVPIKEEV